MTSALDSLSSKELNFLLRESSRHIVRDEALDFGRPIATPTVQGAHAHRHYQRIYVHLRALANEGCIEWLRWKSESRMTWWWWTDAAATCSVCGASNHTGQQIAWIGGRVRNDEGRLFVPGSGAWACHAEGSRKRTKCEMDAFVSTFDIYRGRERT